MAGCDALQGGFKQALFKLFLFNIKYKQLKPESASPNTAFNLPFHLLSYQILSPTINAMQVPPHQKSLLLQCHSLNY